jgi:hypothetical protein
MCIAAQRWNLSLFNAIRPASLADGERAHYQSDDRKREPLFAIFLVEFRFERALHRYSIAVSQVTSPPAALTP